MDTMRFSAKVMVSRSVTSCHLKLCDWKVDGHTKQVLCSTKFVGAWLFREKLVKVVVDSAAKSKQSLPLNATGCL